MGPRNGLQVHELLTYDENAEIVQWRKTVFYKKSENNNMFLQENK